jgi:DNA-binding Xre family transcriptional regulator
MSEIKRLGYTWHLRQLMAQHNLWKSTELRPLLRDRGINLSDTQIYRLVTGTPERISLGVLVALCDIFDCSPADLIEPKVELRAAKTASAPRLAVDSDPGASVAHRIRLVKGDDGPLTEA